MGLAEKLEYLEPRRSQAYEIASPVSGIGLLEDIAAVFREAAGLLISKLDEFASTFQH